jgi:hypothetical protein
MSRLFQVLALCVLFFTTTLTTACGGDEDAKKTTKVKKAKKAKRAKRAKAGKRGKKAGKAGKAGKAKKGKKGKKGKKAQKSTAPKCQIKGLKSCRKDSDCFPTPEEDFYACEESCCKTTL